MVSYAIRRWFESILCHQDRNVNMRSESVECVMFMPDTPENRAAFEGKELLLAEIYKLSNIKIVFKEIGGLAQLGERLPCTQKVNGSIPLSSTNLGFLC